MNDSKGPRAGGVILAGAILVGAVAGILRGQATIGVMIGTGAGIAAAVGVWLLDRTRRGT